MNDTVNSDGNLFGRFVALVLIVGVALGAHRLSCSGSCFLKILCCRTVETSVVPAVPQTQPVEAPKRKVRKHVETPLETALPPSTP